jgi:hypothetical protein
MNSPIGDPVVLKNNCWAAAEGQEIGRMETLRENILEVIETRFGPVPTAVRDRINALEDSVRLKHWLRLAVICVSLRDFEQDLTAWARTLRKPKPEKRKPILQNVACAPLTLGDSYPFR